MKYKVGDKVRVRKDIKSGERFCLCSFTDEMQIYAGKIVTIKTEIGSGGYEIIEDNGACIWKEEMFDEPLNRETSGTDAIKPDYYQFHGYDVFDIAEHFGLSFPLGNALKYLLRAGKKDSATWEQDLSKCKKCIERAMEMRRSE
jgi:hypothetical protein